MQQENESHSNLEVIVRIRPGHFDTDQHFRLDYSDTTITVHNNERRDLTRRFEFNQVINTTENNQAVFDNVVRGHLEACCQGYNLTLMAYGVTGSGKTHTIFGDQAEQGLAIKSIRYLTEQVYFESITLSYLEIYNETVRDLLQQDSPNGKTMIPDLYSEIVSTPEHAVYLIQQGNSRRALAATNNNQASSRSHAVLQIALAGRYHSRLTIIDLAGSERTQPGESSRVTLEGSNINRSLLALGNCINALADPLKRRNFVPYRDSKLTRILKESLSGNSKSLMFACVSLNPDQKEETINTLTYARRASTIKTHAHRNKRLESDSMTVNCPNCICTFTVALPTLRSRSASNNRDCRESFIHKEKVGQNPLNSAKNISSGVTSSRPSQLNQLNTAKIEFGFEQLKQKIKLLIDQSIFLGKNPYQAQILEEVFQSNRAYVFQQIDSLQNLLKQEKQSPDTYQKQSYLLIRDSDPKDKENYPYENIKRLKIGVEDLNINRKGNNQQQSSYTLRMKRDEDERQESSDQRENGYHNPLIISQKELGIQIKIKKKVAVPNGLQKRLRLI